MASIPRVYITGGTGVGTQDVNWEVAGERPADNPWEPVQERPAQAAPAAPTPAAPPPAEPQAPPGDDWQPVEEKPLNSYLSKALEPITSLPRVYGEKVAEARHQMDEGTEQALNGDGWWEKLKGVGNTAMGVMNYATAPITAPVNTIVGKPLEENFGIPHEYSEFAAQLAIPGIGLRGTATGAAVGKGVSKGRRLAEELTSPDTVSPAAENAATAIRSATGNAARATASTEAELDQFQKIINQLPDRSKLDLVDYIERRSTAGGPVIPKSLQPVADSIRGALQERMTALQALPSKAQAQFIEDYYPHFWKDPNQGRAFAAKFGSKEGSGANLKKREIPTIADGIAAGLVPSTVDPIAATLKYVQNMDRFIGTTKIMDEAIANGTVRRFTPGMQPAGWVEVNTARAGDLPFYAPKDWARVYNNFTSKGAHGWGGGEYGETYDMLRRGSGALTALELGLSGYHALTMGQEAIVNGIAKAVDQLAAGQPWRAAGSALRAPLAPVALPLKGHQLEKVYLGKATGDPLMRQITDLLTEAGGRAKGGKNHALDYEYSRLGSYVTAFKKATLKGELAEDLKDIYGRPIVGTAKAVTRNVGRIMDTVAQPLFEKYIPKMKNGAFYENMADWLQRNPQATREQQIKAAQHIWDSIDNRFGEMVQDNIFWDKFAKQAAMLSLRSFSWTLGGPVREIGGGVRDLGRVAMGGPWTSKASYVIALPFTFGLLNATYQFLKTGQPPESMQDLLAPRTGGVDARSGLDERILMPGYMKDVFGFIKHPVQEATNKLSTGVRMLGETISIADGQGGKDWRGDPILSPPDPSGAANAPRWLVDYLTYLRKNIGPITIRQLMQGPKEGSNLNAVEQALGTRTSSQYMTDPQGYQDMMTKLRQRAWTKKRRYEERQKSLYQGFSE